MKTLVFMNDPIWREPGRPVLDLRQSALIETNDLESLEPFISALRSVQPSRWPSRCMSRNESSSTSRWNAQES